MKAETMPLKISLYYVSIFIFAQLLMARFLVISAQAFWIAGERNHQNITLEALNNNPNHPENIPVFSATLSNNTSLNFSNKALDQIVNANVDVDDNQRDKKFHFDDEFIPAGSSYLLFLKQEFIINKLFSISVQQNGAEALEIRQHLGRALHTIQDYYSHTTWTELNPGGGNIDVRLGRERISNSNVENVNLCAGDLSTFDSSTGILTSGFTGTDGSDTCENVNINGQKCAHGGLIPSLSCEGINKDSSFRAGFSEARNLATAATRDYVNQVLEVLAGNDPAIRLLMVDDIKSMNLIPVQPFNVALIEGQGSDALSGEKQLYGIQNNGNVTFNYTVENNSNWVSLSRVSGTLPLEQIDTISLTINSNALSLPVGTHTDTVTISNGETSLQRQVQLTISSGGMSVSPTAGLTYSGVIDSLAGKFRNVELRNRGEVSVQWNVKKNLLKNWYDITPVSGTIAPEESFDVKITLNNNSDTISEGTALDSVLFTNLTSGQGTATVPLRLITIAGSIGNCNLLLHFDGQLNSSADIVDSSSNNRIARPINPNSILDFVSNSAFADQALGGQGGFGYTPANWNSLFDTQNWEISLRYYHLGLISTSNFVKRGPGGWGFTVNNHTPDGSSQLVFKIKNASTYGWNIPWRANRWNAIRFSYDAENHLLRGYFNGLLVGSGVATEFANQNFAFQIGVSDVTPNSERFATFVDEFKWQKGGSITTNESYQLIGGPETCN